MNELYSEISEDFRQKVDFIFEMALRQDSLIKGIKTLTNFLNTCIDEREKEYALLTFSARIMEYKTDENIND